MSSDELLTHEERLAVAKERHELGSIRARKRVDTHHVQDTVPRQWEETDMERVSAAEGDSGEIEELPDGSVSIPVFEEEIVVTKRMKVRERVIIRKRTLVEQFRVDADLRVEHVDVVADAPELLADGGVGAQRLDDTDSGSIH